MNAIEGVNSNQAKKSHIDDACMREEVLDRLVSITKLFTTQSHMAAELKEIIANFNIEKTVKFIDEIKSVLYMYIRKEYQTETIQYLNEINELLMANYHFDNLTTLL